MQKALQLPFLLLLFLFFFLLVAGFRRTAKSYFKYVSSFMLPRKHVTKIGLVSLDTKKSLCKYCSLSCYSQRVWHAMCFRKIINGGNKLTYTATDILRIRSPAFEVILPYLQEYSYLHYRIDYGHQTWQSGDLPRGTPIHKVTWPLNFVVFQNHVTN